MLTSTNIIIIIINIYLCLSVISRNIKAVKQGLVIQAVHVLNAVNIFVTSCLVQKQILLKPDEKINVSIWQSSAADVADRTRDRHLQPTSLRATIVVTQYH